MIIVRANFLVPTLMDKVYLEGERQASMEVCHQLFGPDNFIRICLEKKNNSNYANADDASKVDGGIMDQMTVVGLATDCGNIVPKDLWAHRSIFKFSVFCQRKYLSLEIATILRIRLASQQGDIISEGTMEGDVIAETQGEGDFKARCQVSKLLALK